MRIKVIVEEKEPSAEDKTFLVRNEKEHCQVKHNSIEITVRTLIKQVTMNVQCHQLAQVCDFLWQSESLCTDKANTGSRIYPRLDA